MRYSNTLVHFGAKARTPLNSLTPRVKAQGKSNSGERDYFMKHEVCSMKNEIFNNNESR